MFNGFSHWIGRDLGGSSRFPLLKRLIPKGIRGAVGVRT